MQKVMRQFLKSLALYVVLALVGCGGVGLDARKDERAAYVEYLQGIIADAKETPDFFIGNTLTDSEEQCKREMVYLDDRYLSYRIMEKLKIEMEGSKKKES